MAWGHYPSVSGHVHEGASQLSLSFKTGASLFWDTLRWVACSPSNQELLACVLPTVAYR